jgi:RNA polymerase sigma factor (sigma-70 family)
MAQAILRRIAAAERLVFAELIDMYQRQLFGFLGRLSMSQAQAEDIAQETFLRAWTHLHRYQLERAQLVTWLFTPVPNPLFGRRTAGPGRQRPRRRHAQLAFRAIQRHQWPGREPVVGEFIIGTRWA